MHPGPPEPLPCPLCSCLAHAGGHHVLACAAAPLPQGPRSHPGLHGHVCTPCTPMCAPCTPMWLPCTLRAQQLSAPRGAAGTLPALLGSPTPTLADLDLGHLCPRTPAPGPALRRGLWAEQGLRGEGRSMEGAGRGWAGGRGCTDPPHLRPCSVWALLLTPPIPSPPLHAAPDPGDGPKPRWRGPRLWVPLPGHRPPVPGPPCRGGDAGCGCAQVQYCSAGPKATSGFLLCFNQTAAVWSETSRQRLCLQPKQRSPARSRQGVFAETAAPTESPGLWAGVRHRCHLELAHACAKRRAVPIFPVWPR